MTVPESPWVILSADRDSVDRDSHRSCDGGRGQGWSWRRTHALPTCQPCPLVPSFAFLRSLPRLPIAGSCHTSGGRTVTWCLGPRWQDSFQPWLSGRSARHGAAEAHTVISSPKPQAVPASVKCDLSRAAAGPSKQAIFMK